MKTLFPEMDQEIRDARKAELREAVQRARDWIRNRDTSWLINLLLEHGPQTEMQVLFKHNEDFPYAEPRETGGVLADLMALWRLKKLWKEKAGFHWGAGVTSYKFGIAKVHGR